MLLARTATWMTGSRYTVTNAGSPSRIVDTLKTGARQLYRVGTGVPNFSRKIRLCQPAVSDYECRFLEFRGSRVIHGAYGWDDSDNRPLLRVANATSYPFSVPTTPTITDQTVAPATARAVEKAWSEVHAMRTHMLLLPAVVEFRSVALLIKQKMRKVGHDVANFNLKANRAIRKAEALMNARRSWTVKRAHRAARRIIRRLASSYLGVVFGLLPTISDIQGAIEAYDAEYSIDPLIRITAAGAASRQVRSSRDNHQMTDCGFFRWSLTQQVVTNVKLTMFYRASRLRASVTAPVGLDSRSLAQSFWEATPWSWLVDYFTNVGSWINSSALMHFRPDFCVKSTNVRSQVDESFDPSRPPSTSALKGYFQDCTGGAAVTTAGFYHRASGPLPRVAARVRTLDEIFSLSHVLNVTAVALTNSSLRAIVGRIG